MKRINRKLIITILVSLVLTTVLCSWGNFNHYRNNNGNFNADNNVIVAHFSYSTIVKHDLRKSNYNLYFLENYNTPLWVYQDLHKQGKTVGVKIYQGTHPFPETAYIDNFIPRTMEYVDFYVIWEENPDSIINELNNTYDYIKSRWPDVQVYQSPRTNGFDYARLDELKCDGLMIGGRWWYSSEYPDPYTGITGTWEERFLEPALARTPNVIHWIYLGVCSDMSYIHPNYVWSYSIGHYQTCRDRGISVLVYEMFWPGYEELVKERIKILQKS